MGEIDAKKKSIILRLTAPPYKNVVNFGVDRCNDDDTISRIHSLIVLDQVLDDAKNSLECYYLACYYKYKIDDKTKLKSYLHKMQHTYDDYFGVAYFYDANNINKQRAKKYYLKIIKNNKLGISAAYHNMYVYYAGKKKYDKCEYYLQHAFEHDRTPKIDVLLDYYKSSNCYAKIVLTCIKYNYYKYLLNMEFKNITITPECLEILSNKTDKDITDAPEIIKIIHKLLVAKLEPIDLHFKFSIEGKGYDDAKNHFIDIVTSNNTENNKE